MNLETFELIIRYAVIVTLFSWFLLAVVCRVIIDYITFFSSWFKSDSEQISLQKHVTDALSYEGPFKNRVMAKALLRMARDIDSLKKSR
ncbi:hypothetical protein [Leptospira weilii]|uniref:hypothetical protein n=2 Tax=Leptospira weilii TaxID=28184 RepID=UPI0002487BB2|nr:hypothetical protein [Leptospira weilii]MCL8268304.1 hypothetical protein [Leptospira weilii]OMI18879.1 hypothetical protein BUQ74_03050 [Leptospira weilii serovar Heyan]QDK22984.1 hypothetical protein FHG67_09845 [Leptospira weilii]QDK27372.1 hypothetical protein FHG68_12390 [Leptospira weilii]